MNVSLESSPCGSSKNLRFGGIYRLHLQGNDTLVSSQLAARICLTTDGEGSLLHGVPAVEFNRYRQTYPHREPRYSQDGSDVLLRNVGSY
jgi:hypothetical protein